MTKFNSFWPLKNGLVPHNTFPNIFASCKAARKAISVILLHLTLSLPVRMSGGYIDSCCPSASAVYDISAAVGTWMCSMNPHAHALPYSWYRLPFYSLSDDIEEVARTGEKVRSDSRATLAIAA